MLFFVKFFRKFAIRLSELLGGFILKIFSFLFDSFNLRGTGDLYASELVMEFSCMFGEVNSGLYILLLFKMKYFYH